MRPPILAVPAPVRATAAEAAEPLQPFLLPWAPESRAMIGLHIIGAALAETPNPAARLMLANMVIRGMKIAVTELEMGATAGSA